MTKRISKENYKNIFFVSLAILFCHNLIEKVLSNTIVEHFTSYIDSSLLNDLIVILASVICVFYTVITEKDLLGFLEDIISRDPRNQNKSELSKSVITIFDNWPNFKLYLEGIDESQHPYINEFLEFFTKQEELNFKKSIDFKFQMLNIKNVLNSCKAKNYFSSFCN